MLLKQNQLLWPLLKVKLPLISYHNKALLLYDKILDPGSNLLKASLIFIEGSLLYSYAEWYGFLQPSLHNIPIQDILSIEPEDFYCSPNSNEIQSNLSWALVFMLMRFQIFHGSQFKSKLSSKNETRWLYQLHIVPLMRQDFVNWMR